MSASDLCAAPEAAPVPLLPGDDVAWLCAICAAAVAGGRKMLIKDLPVKGSSMVAKRGMALRGIQLEAHNADHIEGRVNDQRIVILCQRVKKTV